MQLSERLMWVGLLVLVCSLLSVIFYAWDKHQAKAGGRRVPERQLHLLALLGGWPGAWWAQQRFRHKTQKVEFRQVFWVTVVAHSLLASAWIGGNAWVSFAYSNG
jgi:uncharacterized membrane protein YsdA (DUF1294 family)